MFAMHVPLEHDKEQVVIITWNSPLMVMLLTRQRFLKEKGGHSWKTDVFPPQSCSCRLWIYH